MLFAMSAMSAAAALAERARYAGVLALAVSAAVLAAILSMRYRHGPDRPAVCETACRAGSSMAAGS